MRVLLISTNTEPFPEPVFPIGAVYTLNALQKSGACVRIFDLRHNASPECLKRELASFQPDRIGLSLRNVDNSAYPATRFYLPAYKSLVKRIREHSSAPVILGGSAFSLFPEEILRELGADAGVRGEGEISCDVFQNPVEGRITGPGEADLGEVAIPDRLGEVFPHFHRYRTIGIQTARGCPYRCIYCTYPELEGRLIRKRPPEDVAGEMAMLSRVHGIRDFFIVDSVFNGDEEHMTRVLGEMARLKPRVRFSCYMKPQVSDAGVFGLLRAAGCIAVDFGTDSGSEAVLEGLHKPFGREDIRKASAACREAGIEACHGLLLGGPGEEEETIRETVSLMDELRVKAVVAMTGIRIYPGTGMERLAVSQGIIGEGESLLEPKFAFPAMGPGKLLKLAYEAGDSRKSWFFLGKRHWDKTFAFKAVSLVHHRGPLWRVLRSRFISLILMNK